MKGAMAVATLAICAATAGAAGFGSIQSSDINGATNINQYDNFTDIFLNGGGGGGGQILDAGYYAYVIGNQNLSTQVTTVGTFNRSAAQGGAIAGLFNVLSGQLSPNAAAGDTGGSGVTLTGNYSSTGVYELAVYQLSTDANASFAAPIDFAGLSTYASKTDNFKVLNLPTNPNDPGGSTIPDPNAVPEPGSMALLALGGLPVLGVLRRRRA
jgi:hypothetical protein